MGSLEYQREWRQRNREKARAACKRWMDANPDKVREGHLRRKYGMSLADYDTMLAAQGGCCALCLSDRPGGRASTFHVDHDHDTGRVRGLLCHNCNRGLGYLGDDPDLLREAADYLG